MSTLSVVLDSASGFLLQAVAWPVDWRLGTNAPKHQISEGGYPRDKGPSNEREREIFKQRYNKICDLCKFF